MEFLLVYALLTGLYYGGKWGWEKYKRYLVRARERQVAQQRQQAELRQRQQSFVDLSRRSREMQLAILHIDKAPDPDFRRAAAAAQNARQVSASWRRRQYWRLRDSLVQHYRRCLAAETDQELLDDSLRDLIEALGLESFEAEYIRLEAERGHRTTTQPTPAGSAQEFQTRLSQLQQEHSRRVEAIRGIPTLSDEIREQLMEAEEQRFQTQLFGHHESV